MKTVPDSASMPSMRCLILAIALPMLATAGQGQSPAQTGAPAATTVPRIPPITQPPSATIMAEPVALMIGAFDADGDARVTRDETSAGVARSFQSIDKDGKGSLGYIGFADWAERWLGDRNALPSAYETDTDGDNRVSLVELQAQFAITLTRLDRDKDGVLVRSELLTLDSARRDDPFRRGRRDRSRPERVTAP